MKRLTLIFMHVRTSFVFAVAAVMFAGCSEYASSELRAMKEAVIKTKEEKTMTDRSLVRFDEMDFDAIANQKWESLSATHADSVVVHWPDGHSTKGIAAHTQEARALLTFAPDAWVEAHPIRFGSDDLTCVTSTIVGTFSHPMYIAGGKSLQPTGRRFRISVCTIARWKDNKIIEKSLYWDNQSLMDQLGLARAGSHQECY